MKAVLQLSFSSLTVLHSSFCYLFQIRIISNLQTWIANGATKFYFYVNSITKEVDGIFRIYENDQNISVERVQWNLFPTEADVPDEQNPNSLIQLGAVMFIAVIRRSARTFEAFKLQFYLVHNLLYLASIRME